MKFLLTSAFVYFLSSVTSLSAETIKLSSFLEASASSELPFPIVLMSAEEESDDLELSDHSGHSKRSFFSALSDLLDLSETSDLVDLSEPSDLPPSNVDFDSFIDLAKIVRPIREENLVSLSSFLKLARMKDTVILDTRSKLRFNEMHVKDAINIDFSDFTLKKLRAIIPDTKTRIIIYCNNNFENEPQSFPTMEMTANSGLFDEDDPREQKPLFLALNVSTYISLYGFGYRNIFELKDLVPIDDPRIEFEGSRVGLSRAVKIEVTKKDFSY